MWTYLGALPQDAVCWHVSILMAELFQPLAAPSCRIPRPQPWCAAIDMMWME